MERRRYDMAVGVFLVLCFFALFFLSTMAMRGFSFWEKDRSYNVTAVFDNVGQLSAGSPVRSSGVLVGRVLKIDLDPKSYKAVVSMRLNERYHFPSDSTATVSTTGLFGAQFVSLEPGLDSKMIGEGGRVFHTQSALVLEKIISRLFVEHINK